MKRKYIFLILGLFISGCGGKTPDNTPTPTHTPTQTPTPLLEVGSTLISPKDNMEMVYVPAGEFEMGSEDGNSDEQPIHTVYLDAYWIDKYEVSNKMFTMFVEETGYQTDAEKYGSSWVYADGERDQVEGADWEHPQGPGSSLSGLGLHPVVHVSWNDADVYCDWVGRRLPTEAEWEKAARGEDGRTYPWGNQEVEGNLLNYADVYLDVDWADSTEDDGYETTAPVGSYPDGVSTYGAMDMAGNVWEWVADLYDEDYYSSSPNENPEGAASGENSVLRGGSWSYNDWNVRSANRYGHNPGYVDSDIGFRCVTSP